MDTKLREVIVQFKNTRKKTYSTIKEAKQSAEVLRTLLISNTKEHFIALFLDGAHAPIAYSVVSIGLQNSAPVHPREVFLPAVACGACALIVGHNHPSGNVEPSSADYNVTTTLKQASEILGIKLLDHVVFSDNSFFSFAEAGNL